MMKEDWKMGASLDMHAETMGVILDIHARNDVGGKEEGGTPGSTRESLEENIEQRGIKEAVQFEG